MEIPVEFLVEVIPDALAASLHRILDLELERTKSLSDFVRPLFEGNKMTGVRRVRAAVQTKGEHHLVSKFEVRIFSL